DAPPFLAYSQLECAAMLLESRVSSKRARAAGLLQEAIEAGDRMGMAKVKRDAELLIASLGG
ncbi:MAG: serine/threonine protein kinase, partial [Candidatus Solibacter sp.]|nr:serine/threonine protein kinase [Candidatus Solibacter sp.]